MNKLFHLFNKGTISNTNKVYNPCYRLFEFRCELVPVVPSGKPIRFSENKEDSQDELTTNNSVNNVDKVSSSENDDESKRNEVSLKNGINNVDNVSSENNKNNLDEATSESNINEQNKASSEINESNTINKEVISTDNGNKQNQYKLNDKQTYDLEITLKTFDKNENDYKYLAYIRKRCNEQEGNFIFFYFLFLFIKTIIIEKKIKCNYFLWTFFFF